MMIDVPDNVGARLQEMAKARGITVGFMVEILLIRDENDSARIRREYADKSRRTAEKAAAEAEAQRKCTLKPGDEGWPPPGSLAELAELARRANLGSNSKVKTDTSSRTKEILNAEFADHISRNWDK